MEFRILGPFEVVDGGRPLSLGGPKQRALLVLLLLSAGDVVSTDRLIDELWGEEPPETAENTVQVYVSQLRKVLHAGGPEILLTRKPGYVLRVERGALHLHRFQQLVDEGRRSLDKGAPEEAAGRLRDALSLFRGRPLADFA